MADRASGGNGQARKSGRDVQMDMTAEDVAHAPGVAGEPIHRGIGAVQADVCDMRHAHGAWRMVHEHRQRGVGCLAQGPVEPVQGRGADATADPAGFQRVEERKTPKFAGQLLHAVD